MVGIAPEVVSRIRRRFVEHGIEGLADQPKAGRKDHAVKPEVVECIVQMALSPPPAGRTRWTTRLIGDEVDLTSATVAKVLRANGLKPHSVRTCKISRDPEFAAKVTDVVGLYLNPPQNAIVLSVDEKTSRTVRARSRSASTSTRTSRIGTTTRLPSSGRNRPLRSSARESECLIGLTCGAHRTARQGVLMWEHVGSEAGRSS